MSKISLPDFLNDPVFNSLRAQMKAPLVEPLQQSIVTNTISLADLEKLRHGGIDVNFDEIEILSNGLLSYKGELIIVYIKDWSTHKNDQNSLPRYHVADCKTLIQKRENIGEKNYHNRYVLAQPVNGKFEVKDKGMVALQVCKNCLTFTNWKNFKYSYQKDNIRDNFSIEEFFSVYKQQLISQKPKHTASDAPKNDYAPDHREIAINLKRQRGYRCDNCNINHSEPQNHKYLHMHHRNGIKFDNISDNLQLLCVRCHAAMPEHSHMKTSPDYAEYCRKFPDRLA